MKKKPANTASNAVTRAEDPDTKAAMLDTLRQVQASFFNHKSEEFAA